MTKLSLFLYSADVLESISSFLFVFGVIAIILAIILCIITLAAWFDDDCKHDDGATWIRNHTKRMIAVPILIAMFFFGASTLIPEKKTMYMIAGVEMADMMIQTETAKTVSNEMKNVLTDITSIIHSYASEKTSNQEAK